MTVSIIIPAFQGAHYLNNFSLPSLIRQDYHDWEAIIIDDASTDNTRAVIDSWMKKDSRIKSLRQNENRGLAAALNAGWRTSRGEVIAFLEQDDIWLSNKLSRQVEILKKYLITDCRFFYFSEKNKKLSGLGGGNFSTFAARREVLSRLFPLPEDKCYLGIEDGLLAGRLALLTDRRQISPQDIFHNEETLVLVARHSRSLSGHGRCRVYANLYDAALNYFENENSASLNRLKLSWEIRRRLNLLLALCPEKIQKIIRRLALGQGITARLNWQKIKKQDAYQAAEKMLSKLS